MFRHTHTHTLSCSLLSFSRRCRPESIWNGDAGACGCYRDNNSSMPGQLGDRADLPQWYGISHRGTPCHRQVCAHARLDEHTLLLNYLRRCVVVVVPSLQTQIAVGLSGLAFCMQRPCRLPGLDLLHCALLGGKSRRPVRPQAVRPQ